MVFETVFSSEGKVKFIKRAFKVGYFIRIFFICTDNPTINLARIAKRVLIRKLLKNRHKGMLELSKGKRENQDYMKNEIKNVWDTLSFFERYYSSRKFNGGLNHYFKVVVASQGYFLFLRSRGNENVSMPHSSYALLQDDWETKFGESICFAIMFYYVCLINYAINEFYGMEKLCDILRQTSLPLVSCGLGGIKPPHHAMTEADLIFVKPSKNQKKAIALFKDTKTFMMNELKKLIQLKEIPTAFGNL